MSRYSISRCRRPFQRVFAVLAVCTVFIAAGGTQGAEVVDRIVAVVNDDILTLYELNQALQPYAENIEALGYSAERKRETLYQFRQKLMNELIDRKLTEQEVKRFNITVGEEEITSYIERVKESKSLTDESLRKGLAEQGLTMEAYRNEVRQHLQRTKLVNLEVSSKVVITREDVEAYYESHRDKYGGERQYYLWNLFVRIAQAASDSERAAARERLEAALRQIEQGRAFEELVKQADSRPEGVDGTDLGLFRLDELSPQLQQVVAALTAGGHSGILETDFGYQLVYLEKVVEQPAKAIEEVQSEIQDILFREFVDDKFEVWLDDLRKRSLVKIIN